MRHVSGLGPKHYAARDPDRRGPTLRSSTSDTFFSHTVLRVPGIPLSNGKYYFYTSTSTATNSTTSTYTYTTTTTSSTTSTVTCNSSTSFTSTSSTTTSTSPSVGGFPYLLSSFLLSLIL